jgi:glucose/arabinose dehydrogenase
MDKMRAIVFSVIAIAAVVGASISLSYVGLNSGTLGPVTSNDTGMPPVQNDTNVGNYNDTFRVLPDSNPPTISDAGLKVDKVIQGMVLPTSMAFLDNDDILILQKDNGRVRLVSNGVLQPNPVFDVFVEKNSERGLLGVAVVNATGQQKTVFLYYTTTPADGDEVRNRVNRYDWNGTGSFTGGTLVLDLPGEPGPNHDGGKMTIGPDEMLYAVIGDLNRNGMLQNYNTGPEPDDTSVIFRVDRDGNAVNGTSKYYAYGIRNSFGLDFDPLTGVLWDTENGPENYDEINAVKPGFNSGWELVAGPINRTSTTAGSLVQLDGSHYEDPVFSWRQSQGVTDIEFLNSTKLGGKYAYNIFVGDVNSGSLYFFTINDDRTGLDLGSAGLDDLVADNNDEVEAVTLGTDFGPITDIETGPDGYLYILTLDGNLYRIVPAG